MKVSSIISVNPNSEKLVQKSPSFRGLWGDTVVKETSDCYSDGAQMIDFYTVLRLICFVN